MLGIIYNKHDVLLNIMVKTSHAALYSIAGIIASQTLGSVCGHSVDVTNLDYVGMATAVILGFADWSKRHLSKTTPQTTP